MLARINKHYVPAYWDDFFNDTFFNGFTPASCNQTSPAVNVVEEDNTFRIDVAVPGMSRKDFRIDLENDLLTISSEQQESKEENNLKYMRKEFSYRTFKRSFQLPESVDQEKIRASNKAGILTIELPKKEEVIQQAPKQIEIK